MKLQKKTSTTEITQRGRHNSNIETFFHKLRETLISKNEDYASSEDPYKNFSLCEKLAGVPTEVGMYVRLTDKVSRLGTLISGKNPSVKSETIYDTLEDLAGYTALVYSYLKTKEEQNAIQRPTSF